MSKTGIQITTETKEKLKQLKTHPTMTFEEVVKKLLKNNTEKTISPIYINGTNKYITKTVKPHGNGAYITLPNKWLGEEIIIIRKKDIEKVENSYTEKR